MVQRNFNHQLFALEGLSWLTSSQSSDDHFCERGGLLDRRGTKDVCRDIFQIQAASMAIKAGVFWCFLFQNRRGN